MQEFLDLFRKQFLFTTCVFVQTVNLLKMNQTLYFQAEQELIFSLVRT